MKCPGSDNEVVATVLVRLPGGEGVIRDDDGEIALTHDVTRDRGQPLQPWDRFEPIRLGLGDDRMLFGGLLPRGAVRVEAVEATGVRKAAAVGGGVFAVIFEDGEPGEPALGYRDAAGSFVHRPSVSSVTTVRAAVTAPCSLCTHGGRVAAGALDAAGPENRTTS